MTVTQLDPGLMPGPLPVLRRGPIPLREPQAARSIAPPRPDSGGRHPGVVTATQGTLALVLPWDGPTSLEEAPAAAGVAASRPGRGTAAPDPAGVLPSPNEWAAAFVQAAMEVASGLRAPAQLVRWTAPEVHAALTRRGALTARAIRRSGGQSSKPRLRALVLSSPAARIVEVAAVMAGPERIRAVAFRMEACQGRWRVTVLEIG